MIPFTPPPHAKSAPVQNTQRKQRVAEVIRAAMCQIVQEAKGFSAALSAHHVTISHVDVSPDLRRATIYVSSLMLAASQDSPAALSAFIDEIRKHTGVIRTQLTRAINLRYAPEIEFSLADSD